MHRISARRGTPATLVLVASLTSALVAPPAAAQLAPGSTLVFGGLANGTDLGSPGLLITVPGGVSADPSANTGAFASLNTAGPPVTGVLAPVVVGSGPQSIPAFLQLGGFTFALTFLPPGPYAQEDCYVPPAVGQRCTPFQLPGHQVSPFYLKNVPGPGGDALFTALVAFDVMGFVTGPGGTAPFVGTISATLEGVSYQEVFALEAAGRLEGLPFSARFVTTAVVPEPSTVALVATGLVGVAGAARRRRPRRTWPAAAGHES